MASEEVEINWEMNDPKVENVIEFRSKPELEGSGAETQERETTQT